MDTLAAVMWESHHGEPHAGCVFKPPFSAAFKPSLWVQKGKQKIDTVDQQHLWLEQPIMIQVEGGGYTFYFFFRMPLPLAKIGETSESSTIPAWWLIKVSRLMHVESHLTTVHCFSYVYLCCFYLPTELVFIYFIDAGTMSL